MVLVNIHALPIAIFIAIPVVFLVPYCVAIYLNHVEVGLPYISDTGAHPPESCIFSQGINIIALLVGIFMYVRYKHVEQHCRDHLSSESTVVLRLNRASLIIGLVGCLGLSVAGNFQEIYIPIVHMIGASSAFGCATIYAWLQCIVSFYVSPYISSLFLARVRLVLAFLMTALFFISLVVGIIAHKKFHGNDATKWYPKDGGFVEHVCSSGAEWLLVIAFDCYILTFVKEMQKISLSSPQVIFKVEDLALYNRDFYNSEDHIISTSPNSLYNLPSSRYGELGKVNVLTTQAIVH